MKRFDPSNKHEDGMAPRTDGEWVRYFDHVEAMKRIAAAPVAQGLTLRHDQRVALEVAVNCDRPLDQIEKSALRDLLSIVTEPLQGTQEPVAWHIGNADGSVNKIGAVYIRRSLAEKHIDSYEGELDASIVPLYAAPAQGTQGEPSAWWQEFMRRIDAATEDGPARDAAIEWVAKLVAAPAPNKD